jgi:type I restriction enzyme M protein
MRRKVHYVIKPEYLWRSVAKLARMQNTELLETLEKAFNYKIAKGVVSLSLSCG